MLTTWLKTLSGIILEPVTLHPTCPDTSRGPMTTGTTHACVLTYCGPAGCVAIATAVRPESCSGVDCDIALLLRCCDEPAAVLMFNERCKGTRDEEARAQGSHRLQQVGDDHLGRDVRNQHVLPIKM